MSAETYKGVRVPKGLRPNWDTFEAGWWRKGVDAVLDTVRPLLEAVTDDVPCRTQDKDGRCWTHGSRSVDGRCVMIVIREFLTESAQEEVWRSTIVIDPYLYWCLNHRPALAVTRVRLADIHPAVEIQCVQCGRSAR